MLSMSDSPVKKIIPALHRAVGTVVTWKVCVVLLRASFLTALRAIGVLHTEDTNNHGGAKP